MTLSKTTAAILLAGALLLGWSLRRPDDTPAPTDRPVLRAIARAARWGLWMLLAAEPAPATRQPAHLAHSNVGADGYQVLDHAAGW